MKTCWTGLVALAMASQAHAAPISLAAYNGPTVPTSVGWTAQTGSATVSAVTDDLGLGTDAWSVNDSSTSSGSIYFYSRVPTGPDLTMADTNGWNLSMTVRVVNAPDALDRAIFTEYISSTKRWRIYLGSDAAGDPIVGLQTSSSGNLDFGTTYTFTGGGSGYHTYSLVFDPATSTADLFIDGVEHISDHPACPTRRTVRGWRGGQAALHTRAMLISQRSASLPRMAPRRPAPCPHCRAGPSAACGSAWVPSARDTQGDAALA